MPGKRYKSMAYLLVPVRIVFVPVDYIARCERRPAFDATRDVAWELEQPILHRHSLHKRILEAM